LVARLNVLNSRELLAVLLAVRGADKAIQAQVRKHTKSIALPEWRQALAEHATTRLQHRALVSTARVAVSNQNVRLSSATVGRPLKGGLNPKTTYYAPEFGANRAKRTTYTATSRRGRQFTVKSRRTTQQLPPRRRAGHVFGPAVSQIVPRIAALWVQTVVRTLAEAFEGKRGDI
jgi:hypothetical protein